VKNLKKELRSLKELTNNLTTRTDGSRATPVNNRAFKRAFALLLVTTEVVLLVFKGW